MLRRPSAASAIVENGRLSSKAPATTPIPANVKDQGAKRSVPTTTITNLLDTDELFTKHPAFEIKIIQDRLKSDADAKKEELRQMVGERYRDLLQASSSIISIAKSSKRVTEALEESRKAIDGEMDPPLPRTSSVANVQNRHLHALQTLAAHMKLLLDAPEHLWRLIERKKFFPAAWLFLLARAIHHALIRDDEQDEESWKSQGVDVLAEFPLVQRQWEAVSQFRSQIIQRATVWLRDASSSVEDVCATLVTLHLLDSLPLHDTLTSAFAQRSRTLSNALATKSETVPSSMPLSESKPSANGSISFSFSQDTLTPASTKPRIREVKESIYSAFTIISQTMNVAREVFEGRTGLSLIERHLEFIQSDLDKNINIPHDLQLTTQTLLANVTSTAHFQLLPRSLQTYKPYVDLTSSSASLRQEYLVEQLNGWFHQSMALLKDAVERWFEELETVKEVWSVRVATRKWVNASTLENREKAQVLDMVDQICRRRIIEIWKSASEAAATTFETSLEISLRSIGSGESDTVNSPVNFLFSTVPLPIPSAPATGFDHSLKSYRSSLKHQLLGRTALLDSILSSLEQCARHIHEEVSLMRSGSRNESRSIIDLLRSLHEPVAEDLTQSCLLALDHAIKQTQGNDDVSIRKLLLLEQVTEDLSSRSLFVEHIGCRQTARDGFVKQLDLLNDDILNAWKYKTVCRIIERSNQALRMIPTLSIGPDPELIQALMEMYEAVQEVTFRWDKLRQINMMQETLMIFIEAWLKDEFARGRASVYNLALLRELAAAPQPKVSAIVKKLDDSLDGFDAAEPRREALECIKRFQTFMPATISTCPRAGQSHSEVASINMAGDKFPHLLHYGPPPSEAGASLDFAKPGPRFGLLLVGGEGSG